MITQQSLPYFLLLAQTLLHLNKKYQGYILVHLTKKITNILAMLILFYGFYNFRSFGLADLPPGLVVDGVFGKILSFPGGEVGTVGYMPFMIGLKVVLVCYF